jgi:hypothetical protein
MPDIAFSPLIAGPLLASLAALAALISAAGLITRARGALLRLAGFSLLTATLAGPHIEANTTRPLPDIALILTDHSQSMEIGNRAVRAAQALAALRATAGATLLATATIPPAGSGGTSLAPALTQALATINPDQLAGIILITDGEIVAPTGLPPRIPLSALLTAKAEETDRELRLTSAPAFGLTGQNQKLGLTVFDHGLDDQGAAVPVTISEDGAVIATQTVAIGQPATITLPIPHPGPITVTAAVTPLPGEVSPINDQAAFTLTGIHKRLEILLISGSPDPGERAWRRLLKSDPAVDLVHFTILRTPGEAIDADPQDIALVPFPIRELFETDINKFDLIILDGFNATGLLPSDYLGNIATFVENGGALLTEVGPEFSAPGSLADSPLSSVLPALPTASGTLTGFFAPAITPLGARHPVTAPFAGQPLAPWYRMEAAAPAAGSVLMTGPDNLPLLILADAGKGRSGIILSDQLWLWTRGGPHDGPALPLLRRIVHYLLREPALEPESLTATITNNILRIDRQTLAASPGPATLTAPDGTVQTVTLTPSAPGHFTAALPVPPIPGVWKLTSGPLIAYAADHQTNAQEFQDLAATAANVRSSAAQIIWLGQTPAPSLPPLLRPRHAVQITGARDIPLAPPIPTLLLALACIALAWWRESGARP